MARFVAIAVLLAIGAGVFAFMQTSNLNVASIKLANAEKEVADLKKKMSQNATQVSSATTELASCKDKVTELQTALDNSKKPAGKR